MITKDEIFNRLDHIYSRIPTMDCHHCHVCCGPIIWFEPEEMRIRLYLEQHDMPYIQWDNEEFKKHHMHCPYLSDDGCRIYPVRPLVCRLQGVAEGLECPYNTSNRMADTELAEVKTLFFSLLSDMGATKKYYGTRTMVNHLRHQTNGHEK